MQNADLTLYWVNTTNWRWFKRLASRGQGLHTRSIPQSVLSSMHWSG